jgi:hypothetical protein
VEGRGWSPSGKKALITFSGVEKDYNDTYVDVLIGLNYYFL